MPGSVPIANSLADIYPSAAIATQAPRWHNLVTSFAARYGHQPTLIARSPGRVNIIGEHIDYSLYSCLPMAITADAIVAVSATPLAADAASFSIRIANVQDAKFPAKEFAVPVSGDVEIDSSQFEWTNYFKSGLRGALTLLREKRGADSKPCSLNILMDGNVPVGGGLSSSAAFVSTSALAVMAANGEASVDKTELTELAIVSERAVGVNSGGLDQSASVFSEKGSALFVSFSPSLTSRAVKFPPTNPELCFVIAQSFVTSNKHVTAPIHYNLRVVECSLAAAYLNAKLNPPGTQLPADAGPLGWSLRGFHDTFFTLSGGAQDGHAAIAPTVTQEEELTKLIYLTEEVLSQEEGYTREEIASTLGITVPELESRFSKIPVRADRFKLRQRALHVFSEAIRVLRFVGTLESPLHTGRTDTSEYNEALGAIMNETQVSCNELYECSCPEIDDICRIARRAGAYGSRLTGAGWGGCSVHLVPADKVADVRKALEEEFYAKRELTEEQREGAVVVSRPATGSAVYMVKEGGFS